MMIAVNEMKYLLLSWSFAICMACESGTGHDEVSCGTDCTDTITDQFCDDFAQAHGCASGFAHLDSLSCINSDAGSTGRYCDMVGCSSTQDTPCPALP